jgi:hypothetical protein
LTNTPSNRNRAAETKWNTHVEVPIELPALLLDENAVKQSRAEAGDRNDTQTRRRL